MRRALLLLSFIGLSLLGYALWPDQDDEAGGAPTAQPEGQRDDPPVAAREERAWGARVTGVVLRDGRPVSNARVSLKTVAPLVARTLDDGRFLFDEVPSGVAYLAASTEDAASEVLGPYQLAPGGALSDVVINLAPSVKVAGRIIDLLTRKPIAGAQVVSPVITVRTDAEGAFTLPGARTQTWLDITAEGFLTRTEWVSMELATAGGRLELTLTPSSYLEGTVLEAGAPVPAATVWAEFIEGLRHGQRSANVFSDKEGRFRVEASAGVLQLFAVTVGGARIKGPVVRVGVGEKRTGLVLDSGPVISVAGTVTRAGQPLAGAQLTAIDALTEDVSGVAHSQADGAFRFDGLARGQYVLQVRAGTLTASVGPFEHRGDGMAWHVELPKGGVLKGRVEPAGPGVLVRWRSGSWSGPSAQTVTTAEGTFEFDGLPDGLLTVDAEGPGGAATSFARVGDELVLRLGRGEVVLRLRDDEGQQVSDGIIAARSLETGTSRRQYVLAPDGAARLELPHGRWLLTLEVTGRGRSADVEVQVGDAAAQATLTLETSVVVSGRVVSRDNSMPLTGVRVEAVSGAPGRGSRVSVLTDVRGEFLLPPVPRSATLRASREGYNEQWRRAVDGARWDFSMDPLKAGQQARPESEQFEGVGMTLDGRDARVRVLQVSEGSPAERAGVQSGDLVLMVNGEPTAGKNLNDVVARIRGPAGTPVLLTFDRNGQVFDLTIRRKLLTL